MLVAANAIKSAITCWHPVPCVNWTPTPHPKRVAACLAGYQLSWYNRITTCMMQGFTAAPVKQYAHCALAQVSSSESHLPCKLNSANRAPNHLLLLLHSA